MNKKLTLSAVLLSLFSLALASTATARETVEVVGSSTFIPLLQW